MTSIKSKNIKSLLFVIYSLLITNTAFAVADIPYNPLTNTVFILNENNYCGSGFYMVDGSNFYFVTARHVIYDKDNTKDTDKRIFILKGKTANLSSYSGENDNLKKTEFKINLKELENAKLIRYSETHDVAIIHMGLQNILDNGKTSISYSKKYIQRLNIEENIISNSDARWIKKFSEVPIGNEVFIFGYPVSLGFYEKPLLRKGIVAGKNFNNKTLILDCPSYQGNSGGPAVIVEELDISKTTFLPIGVVAGFIPFEEEWVNNRYEDLVNKTISNSGYSIIEPIDFVIELFFK